MTERDEPICHSAEDFGTEPDADGVTEHGDQVYLNHKKRYRLRPLISDAIKGEKMAGLTIEGTGNLKDYLIITIEDYKSTPPSMISSAFKTFKETLKQPVLIIPDTWTLCVFEPVAHDDLPVCPGCGCEAGQNHLSTCTREESFKVGDWVRHPDGIGRVELIAEGSSLNTTDGAVIVQVRRWLTDGFGGHQSWRAGRLSHTDAPNQFINRGGICECGHDYDSHQAGRSCEGCTCSWYKLNTPEARAHDGADDDGPDE